MYYSPWKGSEHMALHSVSIDWNENVQCATCWVFLFVHVFFFPQDAAVFPEVNQLIYHLIWKAHFYVSD